MTTPTPDLKSWAELLTGPFAALMLAISIIWSMGAYLPKVVDRHFQAVDRMMEEHKADREIYRSNMEQISRQITEISIKLDDRD